MRSPAASVRPVSTALPVRLLVILCSFVVLVAACGGAGSSGDGDATADDDASGVAGDELALPVVSDDDDLDADFGEPSTPPPAALEVPGLPQSVEIPSTLNATAVVEEGVVAVWAEPDSDVDPEWELAVPTEFGGLRHFLVLEELTTSDGSEWLRIQVPVRPNGTEGWIPRSHVTLNEVTSRVLIDLSDRSVVVWDGDDIVIDTRVAIGTDRTPTPTGTYYVRDSFPWNPESVYGPWVFALSSYSEVIDQINGGDAVVALHGTRDNSVLGEAVSLGCIRIDNDVLLEMSTIVEPGTPVEVVP